MWFDDAPITVKKRKRKQPKRRNKRNTILEVKARPADQQRERRHRAMAITIFLAAVIGVAVLLVLGGRSLGRLLYSQNDLYALRTVEVRNPGGKLKPQHISEYAGLREGDNLFALGLPHVLNNLESAPLIKHVSVRRKLPDTLVVDVVERSAIATVASLWAVDLEGFVLGPGARSPYLPSLVGYRTAGLRPGTRIEDPLFLGALRLIDLCDATQLNRYIKVKQIDCSDPEKLDVQLVSGERVVLARDRVEERLNVLVQMISKSRSDNRNLKFFDLTGETGGFVGRDG